MPSPSSELAWSVVREALDASEKILGGDAWIPQPEAGPACLDVLGKLGRERVEVFQSFRPDVKIFEGRGFRTRQEKGEGPFELAICVPTNQRSESLGLIAHALLRLQSGGRLLFACANDRGAGGYLTRLRELDPSLEAGSARKCRWVFMPSPDAASREILEAWIREAREVQVPGTDFRSVPGIYGWNKIDRASELLVSTLPEVRGKGADLGAGYGYLSRQVLEHHPGIESLNAVEADARALECARWNLRRWDVNARFHWLDVTDDEVLEVGVGLDWVVMNPPFHGAGEVETRIGRRFIENARALLKPGGRLFMVANAFLPYEDTLMKIFSKSERVLARDGFKVIHAVR